MGHPVLDFMTVSTTDSDAAFLRIENVNRYKTGAKLGSISQWVSQ